MPRNKLTDLNNLLFEQMERLIDNELEGEALNTEIRRAKAVTDLGEAIVDNARLELEAAKFMREHFGDDVKLPEMLEGE